MPEPGRSATPGATPDQEPVPPQREVPAGPLREASALPSWMIIYFLSFNAEGAAGAVTLAGAVARAEPAGPGLAA